MKRLFFISLLLGIALSAYAQNAKKDGATRCTETEKMPAQLIKKNNKKPHTITRDNTPLHKAGNKPQQKNMSVKSNGMWDVQFSPDVAIGSGIETDGSHFFVSQWNMDSIFVFDLNGAATGKFRIPVTGIRDMAFDGTYFYGSNASNVIYKMNFTSHQVVDSIICPAYISVRHIAYDNVSNGFWVGDWDTDIYLVNQSGTVINTISAADHDLYGMYGSAFDNTTAGGPYLWIFDQGGYGCDLVMIKISTGKKTGIIHDCTEDVASNLMDPVAGGLFIRANLVPGKVTLGGILQHQRIFGYDLATVVKTNDVGVEDILSPILSSGCTMSSNETITVRIRNYGLSSAGNFNLHMNLNGVDYNKNITNTLNSFAYLDVSFAGTFDFSQPLVYKMEFNTTYTSDQNTSNDTAYYTIITGNGLITVDILTDSYANETYWEVYNNFTYDVYGYPYYEMDTNTFYSTDVCIDTNLCYGFTIFDSYGDGISAPGYYEVFFNGNSVAYQDSFTTLFEEVPYIGYCDYADVGITGIISPVSSCNLTNEELVTVVVKNFGTQTVDSAEVAFTIGGSTFVEPLPFSLNSQEEIEYTFINLCDLSFLGMHDLTAYSVLNADMNSLNDTVSYDVEYYTPANMPYVVDFENDAVNAQLLIEDENQDYFSWSLYNTGGVGHSSCALYSFNPNEPANDWLFSKCIELTQGEDYVLNFYYKAESPAYPEKLKVHLSAAPFSAATFTDPIIDLPNISDTSYTLASVPFDVDDEGSGNYFLGFNVYSDLSGWNLYLDDISVSYPADISEINEQKKQFMVYPNPASASLTITQISGFSKKENMLYVYNIQGQLLMQQMFNTFKTDIDIHNLENGLYLLKIENDEGVCLKKFVKN